MASDHRGRDPEPQSSPLSDGRPPSLDDSHRPEAPAKPPPLTVAEKQALLRQMSGEQLGRIYHFSNLLSFAVLLMIIFVGHSLYLKYQVMQDPAQVDANTAVLAALCGAQLINAALAIHGGIVRSRWGYVHLWILAIYIFPLPPVGPLASVIGGVALVGGFRLFGPNRFTHRQLKAEVECRGG